MGGSYCIDLGGNSNNQKINKIIIYPGLRRPPNNHLHATTNQKQALIMEESRERRQDYRGAWGGCKSIVLAMIEAGVL
jgi:hypothetical protein